MRYVQRSVVSIHRRFKYSIILFLIIFVICTFISCSAIIFSSTQTIKKSIVSSVGTYINLTLNNYNENSIYAQFYQDEFGTAQERYMYESKVSKVFDEFAKDESVVFAEQVRILWYDNVHLAYEDFDEYNSLEDLELQKKNLEGRYVRGVDNELFTDLMLGNIHLVEGRSFTHVELDNGVPVAIISKDYQYTPEFCSIIKERDEGIMTLYDCRRNLERIEIGDEIPFEIKIENKDGSIDIHKTMYKVIGFFISDDYSEVQPYPKGSKDFEIYVPRKTLENELSFRSEILQLPQNTQKTFSSIFTYMYKLNVDNLDELKEFCIRINQRLSIEGLDEYWAVSSATTYESVIGPLNSLQRIAEIVLYASIVISIAIMILVNILFIRERKYEFGILTALGEKKRNIIIQVFLEIMIVGMLANSFSIIVGNIFGEFVSNKLLDIEMKKQEEIIEEKLYDVLFINAGKIDKNIVVEKYDAQLTFENVTLIYFISLSTMGVTAASVSYYVLSMKPKDILL